MPLRVIAVLVTVGAGVGKGTRAEGARAEGARVEGAWVEGAWAETLAPPQLEAGRKRSYQRRVRVTIFTSHSITGTSISTPTTVARAAPESKP